MFDVICGANCSRNTLSWGLHPGAHCIP